MKTKLVYYGDKTIFDPKNIEVEHIPTKEEDLIHLYTNLYTKKILDAFSKKTLRFKDYENVYFIYVNPNRYFLGYNLKTFKGSNMIGKIITCIFNVFNKLGSLPILTKHTFCDDDNAFIASTKDSWTEIPEQNIWISPTKFCYEIEFLLRYWCSNLDNYDLPASSILPGYPKDIYQTAFPPYQVYEVSDRYIAQLELQSKSALKTFSQSTAPTDQVYEVSDSKSKDALKTFREYYPALYILLYSKNSKRFMDMIYELITTVSDLENKSLTQSWKFKNDWANRIKNSKIFGKYNWNCFMQHFNGMPNPLIKPQCLINMFLVENGARYFYDVSGSIPKSATIILELNKKKYRYLKQLKKDIEKGNTKIKHVLREGNKADPVIYNWYIPEDLQMKDPGVLIPTSIQGKTKNLDCPCTKYSEHSGRSP
jgi:hypothetical protein